jgi:hypothetical protein
MIEIICSKETIEGHVLLVPATFDEAARLGACKDGTAFIAQLKESQRTGKQNAAIHVFFQELAEALNNAGYDLKTFLNASEKTIPVPWTAATVKETLWRPVQKALTGKTSTTEQTTVDPSKVYDVLMKRISELTGVYVEFPNNRG